MRLCRTCEFWDAEHSEAERGTCRVMAPVAHVGTDGQLVSAWPATSRFDWCGMWCELNKVSSAQQRDEDVAQRLPGHPDLIEWLERSGQNDVVLTDILKRGPAGYRRKDAALSALRELEALGRVQFVPTPRLNSTIVRLAA